MDTEKLTFKEISGAQKFAPATLRTKKKSGMCNAHRSELALQSLDCITASVVRVLSSRSLGSIIWRWCEYSVF